MRSSFGGMDAIQHVRKSKPILQRANSLLDHYTRPNGALTDQTKGRRETNATIFSAIETKSGACPHPSDRRGYPSAKAERFIGSKTEARSHECERCTHVPRGRPLRHDSETGQEACHAAASRHAATTSCPAAETRSMRQRARATSRTGTVTPYGAAGELVGRKAWGMSSALSMAT